MRIAALDLRDPRRVDAVVDLMAAAQATDFPDDPEFAPSWERGRLLHPLAGAKHETWLAVSEDDVVQGVLKLELPELDNVTTALGELIVHPDARRRGIGRTLAVKARERAVTNGRKLLIAFSVIDGTAEQFLRSQGYVIGLNEHRQKLVVTPERQASWARMHAEALPYAEGYTLVRWQNETPAEYVDGLAYLTHRMSIDAPLGDLQWEAEAWDGQRVRDKDRRMASWGRRIYTTAAIHDASGQMAGYTSLAYATEDPTHAWQWNTIVDPEHRGHRLGTLLKVANHAFTFDLEPDTRTVFTWNAESNKHMNAINTALGFAPIDRWAESQLRLD